MNSILLSVCGLKKRYGPINAVAGIDLELRRGEILGLLGPNGAGKTTAILMMLGLTEPSDGTIDIDGFDPRRDPLEVKRRVGYLPDSVGFYDNLTARQNLRYTARLGGLPRPKIEAKIDRSLRRVGLDPVADRRVGTFSRGMRQRLGIAEILMRGVKLAILDEPTSGLDPQATFELLEIIRDLKLDGTAVLLSSHLLDRVQAVCDRVALFHEGRIVLEGTVPELAQNVLGAGYVFEVEVVGAGVRRLIAHLEGVREVTEDDGILRVLADRDLRAELAQAVVRSNGSLFRLSSAEPSLDAIYRHHFEPSHAAA